MQEGGLEGRIPGDGAPVWTRPGELVGDELELHAGPRAVPERAFAVALDPHDGIRQPPCRPELEL